MVLVGGSRQVLWSHTYHPRYFGGFYRQRRDAYSTWTSVIRDFAAGTTRGQVVAG